MESYWGVEKLLQEDVAILNRALLEHTLQRKFVTVGEGRLAIRLRRGLKIVSRIPNALGGLV